MKALKKFYIRTFQKLLYICCFFLPFREPVIIKGTNSFDDLALKLKLLKRNKVLIVTDKGLHNIKMDVIISDALEKENISYEYFYNINPNPSIDSVEEGVNLYLSSNCDCIIVIGGGSAIDAAKVIGARVTNINTSIKQMKGLLKVKHKLPLLIAIPTTAGTGSETTIAAVITSTQTKEKFPIESCKLIPHYAILNPSLLVNLPPHITSTTGMDALTHAIEAYIGKGNTKKTKQSALQAVQLIFTNLQLSYNEPKNLVAREKMQIASYHAGLAFTRAYVGYVHAIAHTLGGFYNIPHGLANAVILPLVLKEYGKSAHSKLADLYDCVVLNSSKSKEEKANEFIDMIIKLNKDLNIKNTFKDMIKDSDIDLLIKHAIKEAIPLYPTPELWDYSKFEKIYKMLQKNDD